MRTHPIIKASFAAFPGAEIVDIREVATRIEATDNNDELPEDGFDFTLLDRDDD